MPACFVLGIFMVTGIVCQICIAYTAAFLCRCQNVEHSIFYHLTVLDKTFKSHN